MLRRIGVLASLAVVAAMFAGVSTASAQLPPTAGVCIFTGLSGQLQPGIQNAVPDIPPLVDVERGTYNFGGNGTCAGLLNGAPQTGTFPITSAGNFDNIVCGTGFAHDLDGSGTTLAALGVGPTNPAGYEIAFVAGTGPLLIGPAGKPALAGLSELLPADASAPTHPADGVGGGMHGTVASNFVGGGLVNIVPGSAAPPNPPNENCIEPSPPDPDGDTDQFAVTGFFVGAKYK
jgi:hypothetical protein